MNYLNYRINPIVQPLSIDTLQQCSNSLTYISETLPALIKAERPHQAIEGLVTLVDCIELALEYEQHRLRDSQLPVSKDK
jgi:hypothetical protein